MSGRWVPHVPDERLLAWAAGELADIRGDFERRGVDLGGVAQRVWERLGADGLRSFAQQLDLEEIDAACEALAGEHELVAAVWIGAIASVPSPHTDGEFYEVLFRHLATAPDLGCAHAALQLLSRAEDNGGLYGSDILMSLWRTHGEALRPTLREMWPGEPSETDSFGVTLAMLLDER